MVGDPLCLSYLCVPSAQPQSSCTKDARMNEEGSAKALMNSHEYLNFQKP